jgi:hypothetical protein
MGVVNRCAVGIYPSQQLLDWARGLDLDVDAAGAREPCLYLIPDYETETEAEAILEEVYEAIFEAELDYWHRDTGTWPAAPEPQPAGHSTSLLSSAPRADNFPDRSRWRGLVSNSGKVQDLSVVGN